jgi:endonuclease/exonuclease/phosphatase family metal-dependent hydrolase
MNSSYNNKKDSLFGTEIKCVTWNIGLRYDNKVDNIEKIFDSKLHFIRNILKNGYYDIICLQEVELKRGRNKTGISYFMEDFTTVYDYVIHETSDIGNVHGNLTMWKKELFNMKEEPIRHEVIEERETMIPVRMIQTILHHISSDKDICLMNIHFKAGLKTYEFQRVKELNKCLGLINHWDHICICGDFNDNLEHDTLSYTKGCLYGILKNRSFDISPSNILTCCVRANQYYSFWSFDRVVTRGIEDYRKIEYSTIAYINSFPNSDIPTDHLPLFFCI